MNIDLLSSIPTGPRIPPPTYLPTHLPTYPPTYLPTYLPGCLSLQFTTQLQIYTNSHLPSYPTEVAKYYTTFPKYFPGGCFVVYRLLFASFSVNSELVRPFRSFSVPFRSLFGPFSVLFGPFRSFSVLFGPFRCLGRPVNNDMLRTIASLTKHIRTFFILFYFILSP